MARIHLTFDDSPSGADSQLVDILDSKHVKATFFINVRNAENIKNKQIIPNEKQIDTIKKMVQRGHTIGNHGRVHAEPASKAYYIGAVIEPRNPFPDATFKKMQSIPVKDPKKRIPLVQAVKEDFIRNEQEVHRFTGTTMEFARLQGDGRYAHIPQPKNHNEKMPRTFIELITGLGFYHVSWDQEFFPIWEWPPTQKGPGRGTKKWIKNPPLEENKKLPREEQNWWENIKGDLSGSPWVEDFHDGDIVLMHGGHWVDKKHPNGMQYLKNLIEYLVKHHDIQPLPTTNKLITPPQKGVKVSVLLDINLPSTT